MSRTRISWIKGEKMIRTNDNLRDIEKKNHNAGMFEALLSIKSLMEEERKRKDFNTYLKNTMEDWNKHLVTINNMRTYRTE